MIERDFQGKQYFTSGGLDAFAQLHIARKLGPALPLVEGLVNPDNVKKDKTILTVLALSRINDSDAEYVIRKCMSVVQRRQEGGKSARIQAPDGTLMFDDITMAEMLDLAVAVIEENMGDFFRTALGNITAPGAQAV